MDDVFAALQRIGELEAAGQEGGSPVPSWLQTHPDPGERVQRTQQKLATLTRTDTLEVRRAEYLAQVDGLVFGENPRNGYFADGTFLHPDQRFRISLPPQWRAQNTPHAVVAVSPQQDAAIQLTLAAGASPEASARQFLGQQGIQAGQAFQTTVNGVPAVASYFQAQSEQGTVQGMVAFFGYGGRTYQVIGYAPAERFSAYDQVVRQVLGSFAPLTDPQALAVQPQRLRVVRLSRPMSISQVAEQQRSPASPETLALLNQVESTEVVLPAGTMVKIVVPGTAG
jgi:predicted Zn-dependent protease